MFITGCLGHEGKDIRWWRSLGQLLRTGHHRWPWGYGPSQDGVISMSFSEAAK